MTINPHPRFAAALLAAITSGQVQVRFESAVPVKNDPPLALEYDRIKVAQRRTDRDKTWRRWPVRR